MRAIVLEEPRKLSRQEIADSSPPSPGQALVNVYRVGICGTDISGYLGKMPFFRYPVIPGHELGVEVVAVGAGVDSVKPGDRCSVEPYLNDEASHSSRNGHPNCCERLEVLGVHRDGGLRPRFQLPARKLHVSKELSFDQLALVETLAIGCHAVDRSRARKGDQALLIGAGPIGLSVTEFARIAELDLTVLDLNERRLEFCRRQMGIEKTVLAKGDDSDLERLEQITDGKWFSVVFDATGNHRSMSRAANFVGHAGSLVFVGITTQELAFSHPLIHRREMNLLASRNALPSDFPRIIRWIEQGKIDTGPWITHRTSMARLIEDFPAYTQMETGVVKAMVEIDQNES